MIDENDTRVKPLIPLIDGWAYEESDFDDGYVLYHPTMGYIGSREVLVGLFPTIRAMLWYVEHWEEPKGIEYVAERPVEVKGKHFFSAWIKKGSR